MKFYGIDSKGLIKIQEVESLPTWSSNYERSIIYNKQDQILYYGNSTGWSRVIDHIHTNKATLDSITIVDPTVINNLTQDIIDNSHLHNNKILLDDLELVNGKLTYDGEVIGGSILTVDDHYIFNSIADRDAYFAAHPSELVEDLYVVVTDDIIDDGDGGTVVEQVSLSRINFTQASSPVSLSIANCNGFKIFTNTGSTDTVIVNLPSGTDGFRINAIVTAAQDFCFKSQSTDVIRYLDAVSIAGGMIKSSIIGSTLQLDWSGTEWISSISNNTWQLETS